MEMHPINRPPIHRVLATLAICCSFILGGAETTEAARRTKRCVDAENATATTVDTGRVEWLTDYEAAYAQAEREGRMLLVNFVPDGDHPAQRQLDSALENDRSLKRRLKPFVLVRLPADYRSASADLDARLVDHPAFRHLAGNTGVAIIDLKHADTPHYGKIVTALPFSRGKYYRWRNSQLVAALDLPPGTITQRTMVWAVRIHPEAPASTAGRCHDALARAAENHSEHQARIQRQGHHRWETRFHQVRSAARAQQASEVVAESWPNQNLIDSCIDCVASWRHSPGHWRAVRGRHRLFGYDIRRGRNGIWYGTGIFAN